MKWFVCIFLVIAASNAFSQNRRPDFNSIDEHARLTDSENVDSLAARLTGPYASDLEKVRVIFSWITQHIAYNVAIFKPDRYSAASFTTDPVDTSATWKPAIERVAEMVLRRRIAICDGYSKLFKSLCDHSGIPCEIIIGFARGIGGRGAKFRTNHSWNAVMVDSSWRLVDVTWASGYVNYANEFVRSVDESYFLTSPDFFLTDHLPEDLRWTLMPEPAMLREYERTPFRFKTFLKYNIKSFLPEKGVIEANAGDTIKLEVNTNNAERNKRISPDPFFDTVLLNLSPQWVYLSPESGNGNTVRYSFVVPYNNVEWLNLMYNDDVILRYRLKIKDKKRGG